MRSPNPEPLVKVFAGSGDLVPGAIATLAIRLADYAKAEGFVLRGIQLTRAANSPSRYLTLLDRRGRPWIVRVSNHQRRATAYGYPTPHLDVVSVNGVDGFDQACRALGRIIAGGVEWIDPSQGVHRPKWARGRR